MVITLRKNTPESEVNKIINHLTSLGVEVNRISGADYDVLGLVGDTTIVDEKTIRASSYVDEVTRIAAPYKKANRLFHPDDTVVDVDGIKIGGKENIVIIGGPCSIESWESTLDIAKAVKEAGGRMFRGGAYKPRTSPYAFQGLGEDGLRYMSEAKEMYGLPIVSEMMGVEKLDEFEEYVDIIQVGARNMQNFDLLKALGKSSKPILLKRGLSNTIEEWIMAAEYIMAGGNENVMMCERGIRTFERYTRNTLDLSVIPIIKERTHLPIIIDPSHATGDRRYVESMSLAAVAAGADGLIIEVHKCPEKAWSDGAQTLNPDEFKSLIDKSRKIAQVIGRDI